MKMVLLKNRKLLGILLIPVIFMITASLIKLPYDVVSPAYINEVDRVIEINNDYDEKGSFNTVSVYSYERVSLLHYIIAFFDRKSTISTTYQSYNLSDAEGYKAGTIQKNVSITNALIAGYNLASSFNDNVSIDYHYDGYIVDTYYTYMTPNTLKIGDVITKIGEYELNTPNQIANIISKAENNNSLEITVKRNKQILSFNITKNAYKDYYGNARLGYGFSGYDYFIIDSANPTFSINKSSTIGPSGGLLQTLQVVNALITNCDITSGKKIVGTGTIDYIGNVGEIGGIYQKIITADLNNADVFLVPVYRYLGYTEDYIKVSLNNTWIIGSYDTLIDVNIDSIPYLNSDNLWCIEDKVFNYSYYGLIKAVYDENNLDNESNYLEAYRSYKNLSNSKMQFVPISTLEEAVVYLTKDTIFADEIAKKRNAYELSKRSNKLLTFDEWILSISEAVQND